MAAEFRVFLSTVTSEFGMARDAVANDLQARDLQLRVQRSFRQEPGADTLLRLLHDYIRDCAAVVCVIGTRSGACPSPAEAADFAHVLPSGITEASYTQWEFFFARAHKRRLSLYIAAADYQPDRDMPSGDDFPELQMAFIRHIKAAGLHYAPFSNRGDLRAEVLKERWPEQVRAKPTVLPYASLGNLFKGREAFLRQSSPRRSTGWAASVKRGRRSNMPWPIARNTRRCCSRRPNRPRICGATWRASPGRCSCPKARWPRKRFGSTPCWRGSGPIPDGC
jgi:hypothetical protein